MTESTPTIYPTLRYQDAPAALKWLAEAFSLEVTSEVPGPNGTIAHAEMHFGCGGVMFNSARDGDTSPGIYVIVDESEIDSHYARAKAAGSCVTELRDTAYGSREYSARDPEGHQWHFGTYRPSRYGPGHK